MSDPGVLTTYLGAAPGVGKTYAMLIEAKRRAAGGKRVVVGWLEHKDRPETLEQVSDLEVVVPAETTYREHGFLELNISAVLSSNPELVVVDELAHSWPDGGRKRWMDVAELLESGIDVLTSVNVANLVSARDYVARITGAGAVESVPDEFVRRGEVILVDIPADALRARLLSGKVLSAQQVGGALSQYFRVSNLEALSELAHAWISNTVQQVGDDLLARHGFARANSRPLVIAGVSDSAWGEVVIHRAAQLACDNDADLEVVYARLADGTPRRHLDVLSFYRQLTEALGGIYTEVDGESAAQALADRASGLPVSTLVVARHRSVLRETLRGSVARQLRRLRPDLPVEEVRDTTFTSMTPI